MLSNCGSEKTLESPLDSKEIKVVYPKGNKPWIFTGRTNAEAEAPILWPPDVKGQLIGIDSEAGKDWRQMEKWVAGDEIVREHHWLHGHGFEQTSGDSEGQASQTCLQSMELLTDWTIKTITRPHTVTRYGWEVPVLSRVWLFDYPWTVAHHVPLSIEFPRQEY